MGLRDLFKKKPTVPAVPAAVPCEHVPYVVLAPVAGELRDLADCSDPVFASGMLGAGAVIEPSEEVVYAPADGLLTKVSETGHAVCLRTPEGLELMVHVGVDTVDMAGEGFCAYAAEGETVAAGQPLLGFSKKAIEAAGLSGEVVVLVSNSASFSAAVAAKPKAVAAGTPVIAVKP